MEKMNRSATIFFLLLSVAVTGWAAEKTLKFDSPAQEKRYYRLLENLRCMKCANQSLADSQVGLALDLRNKVYTQVRKGKSANQVRAWLVKRYGDYVLYKPRFRSGTWALWFAPLLILIIAIFIYRRVVLKQQTTGQDLTLAEQQRIDELLKEDDK